MVWGHQIIDLLLEKIPELVGEEETATEGGRAPERTFSWQVGRFGSSRRRKGLVCLARLLLTHFFLRFGLFGAFSASTQSGVFYVQPVNKQSVPRGTVCIQLYAE